MGILVIFGSILTTPKESAIVDQKGGDLVYRELINRASQAYPFLIRHTDVRYIPHFHPETEIVYVMDGELTFTLGMQSHSVTAGDICIITPDAIHNLFTEDRSTSFVMKLYPAADLSDIRFDNPILHPGDPGYESLHRCVLQIMTENDTKGEGYQLAVNVCAGAIFLLLLREFSHQRLDSRKKSRHISESNFLGRINRYLESHYMEDFGLEDISEYLGYEKSYFCRYFKRVTGITFWEYYTLFRLEKSVQRMSQNSKETISLVANASGFKNVRSYNEAFRKTYRCTPTEYKKTLLRK